MDAMTASKERTRLWREMKPLLVRSLGRDGAADWLEYAGQQMRIDAQRSKRPIELKPVEWTP